MMFSSISRYAYSSVPVTLFAVFSSVTSQSNCTDVVLNSYFQIIQYHLSISAHTVYFGCFYILIIFKKISFYFVTLYIYMCTYVYIYHGIHSRCIRAFRSFFVYVWHNFEATIPARNLHNVYNIIYM